VWVSYGYGYTRRSGRVQVASSATSTGRVAEMKWSTRTALRNWELFGYFRSIDESWITLHVHCFTAHVRGEDCFVFVYINNFCVQTVSIVTFNCIFVGYLVAEVIVRLDFQRSALRIVEFLVFSVFSALTNCYPILTHLALWVGCGPVW